MSLFARITFLPSLAYNLMKNRYSHWNWFDRIDDQVVLGALPFHGPVTYQLYHSEKIRSVVSMNENFELLFAVTNGFEWNLLNAQYLQLKTADIFHAPKLQQLVQGVEFILQQQKHFPKHPNSAVTKTIDEQDYKRIFLPTNPFLIHWPIKHKGQVLQFGEPYHDSITQYPSVYVHCKAGRTRSATLVACYLIKRYSLTPNQSILHLKQHRPQMLLHRKQIGAIDEYYEHLLQNSQINETVID